MLQTKYGLYGQNNPLFQDLLICSGIYDIKMKTRLSHMIFLLVEAGGGGGGGGSSGTRVGVHTRLHVLK